MRRSPSNTATIEFALRDLDGFLDQRCNVDDRPLVARVDHEQWFVDFNCLADFFDLRKPNRKIDCVVCPLTSRAENDRRPSDELRIHSFYRASGFRWKRLHDRHRMRIDDFSNRSEEPR